MTWDAVFTSAVGQLLAAGILVGCWLVWKTAVLVAQIARAIRRVQVDVTCKKA